MFVLPSVDEAFGVAYVEAMAGAVPAIGCAGEGGPEEIAAAGGACAWCRPGDPEALAARSTRCSATRASLHALGAAARATVARALHLGALRAATVAAYEEALR